MINSRTLFLLISLVFSSFSANAQFMDQWLLSPSHQEIFQKKWKAIPSLVSAKQSDIKSVNNISWSAPMRVEWAKDSLARMFKIECEVRINAWRELIYYAFQDSINTLKKQYYSADTLDAGFERDIAKRTFLVKARSLVEKYPTLEYSQLSVWLQNWVVIRLNSELTSGLAVDANSPEMMEILHQKLANAISEWIVLDLEMQFLIGRTPSFSFDKNKWFGSKLPREMWDDVIRCLFCTKESFDDVHPLSFDSVLWKKSSATAINRLEGQLNQLAFYLERDSLLMARAKYDRTETDSLVVRLITHFRNSYESSYRDQDAVWQSKFDRSRTAAEQISIAEQRENWALNYYNDSESLLRELIPESGFLSKKSLLVNHSKQASYLKLRDIQEDRIKHEKQIAEKSVQNWDPKQIFESFKTPLFVFVGCPILLFKQMN